MEHHLVVFSLLIAATTALSFVPLREVKTLSRFPTSSMVGAEDSRSAFSKIQVKGELTKWQQKVTGIPVYGSVVTTKSDPKTGNINQIQGFISRTASFVDTTPVIQGPKAIEILQRDSKHDKLPALDVEWRLDEPELQILETGDGFDKLVWKVSYYVDWKTNKTRLAGHGPMPAYMTGLINAHTSDVERAWDNLQKSNTKSIWAITGNARYGGQYEYITVPSDPQGYVCYHRNDTNRVQVFDIWHKREVTAQTTSRFRCVDAANWNWDFYSWTDAYSPRNEAYIYANYFVDLWNEVVGSEVTPYRTDTSYLEMYTHYDYQFENAFFNGYAFIFGDGKSTFYPLTSLDIVCHEIGHAITGWKGGNMEYRGQSGGMNEAYSDILGETCDMHFKQKNSYLIAEDIMRHGNFIGDAMRDMCNPRTLLNALDHFSQFNDNVGVHFSSGIYNKAWCTLTKKAGWGYLKGFEVFTDANLMYWHATSTMHCGACGVETAAYNRGYNKADVTAAFDVVGVKCSLCV